MCISGKFLLSASSPVWYWCSRALYSWWFQCWRHARMSSDLKPYRHKRTHTFYFLYKKYFNYLSRMIYPEIRMFSCWKHGDIFTSVFKFFLFTIIAKSTQLFVKKYFMHKIKILLGKTSATHSIQDISSQYLSLQSGKTSTKLLKTILPSLLMSQ